MRSALIIGGTGQIGRAVATALTESGWHVTSAQRGRRASAQQPAVETVQLDRADTESLQRLAAGRDLVVDTVAFSPEHAAQLAELDAGALAVISTAAVYLGSNGTYLDVATDDVGFPDYPVPLTEDWPTIDNDDQSYSPLKAAMERVLLAGELPVSILRAGAVHGPHSDLLREWYYIKRALDGRRRVVLPYGGTGRFHPAATANLAALVLACAQSPGRRVLNAVDDECPTDAEIGRTIFEAMDHDAEIVTVPGPPPTGRAGSPWSVAKPFVLSMEQAHSTVGYRPVLTHAEAIKRDVEWAVGTARARGYPDTPWPEIFPQLLTFGAEHWFDYPGEDDWAGRQD